MRAGLPILLSALALSLPAAAAGAAPPAQFFGVEAKDVFYSPPANQTAELDRQRQAGVGLNRHVFDWAGIERSPGKVTWTGYDAFMANAARRGIEVMPLLFNPPSFRSGRPAGDTHPGTYPPRVFGDLGRFGAAIAARYGPRGSFWAAHPELPRVPVRSYQLWNEPHLPAFWPAGPNPAEYARLLKESAPHIKAADPGARIVTAGISQSTLPGAISLRNFITGMYAAGGHSAFETVAVHPYSETPEGAVGLVEQTRSIMNARGDRASSLWVTEIGWASQGPPYKFTTDEAGQAANLRTLLGELARRRGELGVEGVIWHGWRDLSPPPDWWGRYTGLIRLDGSPKPAWFALRDIVAALRGSPLAPGSSPASIISANLRRDFGGVSAPELLRAPEGARDQQLRSQALLGVGLLRQAFDWRRIEPRRGRYRLAAYDALVAAAARRGTRVMPVLVGVPRFRVSRRTRSSRRARTPARAQDMAGFVRVLARRYGHGGTFWQARRDLPNVPVQAWQVGHEPNLRSAWGGRPNPRRYTALLRAAKRAVRRVDRRAEIVTASLSTKRSAMSSSRFVRGLYRARARSSFDTLGVAPLGRTPRRVVAQVRSLRKLMNRAGDRRAPIWVTGFGWSDRGPRSAYRAGSTGQAAKIASTLVSLARQRRALRLRGVIYLSWRDRRGRSWVNHSGLLDRRGRPKPAANSFARSLRAFG